MICFISVSVIKPKLGYDDSLDAFRSSLRRRYLGALATGLFASKGVNPAGADGLFFGNPQLFMIQLKAVAVVAAYSFIVTFIIYKLVDVIIGVRVSDKEESIGLDLTQHQERAYTVLE